MSDRQEKQLEIVLKLNKLTKQGKLVWSQEFPPVGTTEYVSEFNYRKCRLGDSPDIGLRSTETATINSSTLRFSLYFEGNDDKGIWIPPMQALDDLVSTVRHQIAKRDIQDLDEVLKDLEEAENLLEE